jgi:hypothetical protein
MAVEPALLVTLLMVIVAATFWVIDDTPYAPRFGAWSGSLLHWTGSFAAA